MANPVVTITMNGGAVITNHETKQKIGHVFGTDVTFDGVSVIPDSK